MEERILSKEFFTEFCTFFIVIDIKKNYEMFEVLSNLKERTWKQDDNLNRYKEYIKDVPFPKNIYWRLLDYWIVRKIIVEERNIENSFISSDTLDVYLKEKEKDFISIYFKWINIKKINDYIHNYIENWRWEMPNSITDKAIRKVYWWNSFLKRYDIQMLYMKKYIEALSWNKIWKEFFFRIEEFNVFAWINNSFPPQKWINLFTCLLVLENEWYITFKSIHIPSDENWWYYKDIWICIDVLQSVNNKNLNVPISLLLGKINNLRTHLKEGVLETRREQDLIIELRNFDYEKISTDEIFLMKIKKLLAHPQTILSWNRNRWYSPSISPHILEWEKLLIEYLSKIDNKAIKKEEKEQDFIKLWDSIQYFPQIYLFKNPKNNKEYSIKNTGDYDNMMDILVKNRWKIVTYKDFIESSEMKILWKEQRDTRLPQKRITDAKGRLINRVSEKLWTEKTKFIEVNNGLKLIIL